MKARNRLTLAASGIQYASRLNLAHKADSKFKGALTSDKALRQVSDGRRGKLGLYGLAGEPEQIHSGFVVGLKKLPMRYRIKPAA